MKPLFTFGDLVLDVVARVEGKLEPDTDTPGEIVSAPGGSAANFAVWTARLGAPVTFVGRVGDDLLGRALAADMVQEGVESHIALDPAHPTAVLVLFAECAQRHMVVPAGANHYLDAGDIPEEVVRRSGWVHVKGYSFFWEAPRRAAERVLAIARAASIPISFDPSSAGLIRRKGLKVPAGTQVLTPNADEALALTGCKDVEQAALQLNLTVPLVAIKLGAEGSLLCQEGTLTRVPAARLDGPAVDTTGAGDAWDAAFILAIREGKAPIGAALAANRLGAQIVTRMGARPTIHP